MTAADPDNLFARIIRREIPAQIVYEDDLCLAFNDIAPQAPLHVLLIPKPLLVNVGAAALQDQALLGHLLLKAAEIARAAGYQDFRLVSNSGAGAQQSVFHLHFHILAGREFSWPPG
jgi:histidine triad (HIT) family protein